MSHTTSRGFWDTCGALLWQRRGVGRPVVWSTGWAVPSQPVISEAQSSARVSAWKHFRDPAPDSLQLAATLPCSAALASGAWEGWETPRAWVSAEIPPAGLWALPAHHSPQLQPFMGPGSHLITQPWGTGACLLSKNSWVFHVASEAWAAAPTQPKPGLGRGTHGVSSAS